MGFGVACFAERGALTHHSRPGILHCGAGVDPGFVFIMPEQLITIGTKQIQGRLVIPSGIRCTRASTIEWCFREAPWVGVVTTKSISLEPRPGYIEPIYARYAPGCYINAVGLSNPGARQFSAELEQIQVPDDKFLLVSIFGGNTKEFADTALALRSVADGFELNMSCPHAEGYGVEIGQKRELVEEITAAVLKAAGLPVFVKLSAVMLDVGQTAKAAVAAGAAGITVSNTIGPATVNLGTTPILSNRVGGLSGTGIRPLALRCIKRVRESVGPKPLIIGMGGVCQAEDVAEFMDAGADLVGVGSTLTGLDSTAMLAHLERLVSEIGSPRRPSPVVKPPEITMDYVAVKVAGRVDYHPGLFKLLLDRLPIENAPGELAGRYFFLTIPGVGEKPFAVFCGHEKSIVVRVAGRFTKHLAGLRAGDGLFLRGPYGRHFPPVQDREVVMVGGGTGIASLLEIGKLLRHSNKLHFFIGGRSAQDLFDIEKFESLGAVRIATDDGSLGEKGYVSVLLESWVAQHSKTPGRKPLYILCGPDPMVRGCFKLLNSSAPEDVWAAIEYMTSCGVGICGKCASPSGALTCIDGPFLPRQHFQSAHHHEQAMGLPSGPC